MSAPFLDKLYYRIGEVAEVASVRTSVLRFWETEFDFLKPDKSPKGQRLYTKREVELVLEVRRLLYDEKFTIEGVKKKISPHGKIRLKESAQPELEFTATEQHLDLLRGIRQDLMEVRKHLE